jgi:glycerol-3-phosphate acyltransferase PlsX
MQVSIALDAMGGDYAPQIVIEGAELALLKLSSQSNISFSIYGDKSLVSPLIEKTVLLKESIKNNHSFFFHTDQVVLGTDKPSAILRGKPKSSMRLAIESVRDGNNQAVVSAGNTGAYMALSRMILKSLEGVDRPALVGLSPTLEGFSVFLDMGANIDRSPEVLYQLAVMGHFTAKRLLNKEHPTIGLLNIGSEELKGESFVQQAADRIRSDPNLNYYGFVEGTDIHKGTTDVVVTDGYTGNIALKTAEGTARVFSHFLKKSLSSSWKGRLGYLIAKSSFQMLQEHMDPRLYNGSAFLGLKKLAVKSHGGTDSLGFCSAILRTINLINDPSSEDIAKSIEDYLSK